MLPFYRYMIIWRDLYSDFGGFAIVLREGADYGSPNYRWFSDRHERFTYLDRMVVEVEKAVHTPDEWSVVPSFERLTVTGHEVSDPDEGNELGALIFIEFKYRHDYQDPEA